MKTNTKYYSNSLELLKEFIKETPKEELEAIILKHRAKNIQGPTFNEYLMELQLQLDSYLNPSDYFINIHLGGPQIPCYNAPDQCDYAMYFYGPPPKLKNKPNMKKGSEITQSLFF